MFAKFCQILMLLTSAAAATTHAQGHQPSQEVSLDRQGYASLWALDTPLEAPLEERVGLRAAMRFAGWLSGWAEVRVAWSQKPSIVRLGASAWPIGDPLRGAFISFGPSILLAASTPLAVDAFVETGLRYGWEGVAFTLGARWDLTQRQAVPALTLMLGYTFGGVE